MRVAALIAILAFVAVAEAGRVDLTGLRSLLTDDKHEKEPMYCKDWKEHSDCPDYYECQALDKKACKSDHVCHYDQYGKQTCTYKEVCWDHHCVEVPRYCDPYAKYDECKKEYGYGWECKKLDKKVCTYKDECKHVKGDKCKEYDYEHKCHYIKGDCKDYNEKRVCKKKNVCVEYKQEEKCDTKKVCKAYHQTEHCDDKCAEYNAYGNCVKYGKDCTYKQGGCKEYEYRKHDCKYVPTDKCIKYKEEEHDCKYVKTDCKEYEKIQKCDKIRKGCKAYDYKNECHKVEDVCWHGKCEKKPPPPHSPRYPSKKHDPPSYHQG